MGGLWKKMKTTAVTFLIGALAIAGVPPLAGFWSKELILASTWQNGGIILFLLAVATSLLTAFYMFRLFFKVFTGEYRGEHEPKENGKLMTVPLSILAGLAILAGFVNTPLGFGLESFLTEGVHVGPQAHGETWLIFVSILIAALGIGLAYVMYYKKSINSESLADSMRGGYKLLLNKYYIDELYEKALVGPIVGIAKVLYEMDRFFIDGIVNLVGKVTRGSGRVLVRTQTGQLQTYGLLTVVGGLAIIALAFVLRGYVG